MLPVRPSHSIMLAGIIVQLVVMIVYVAYGVVWAMKARSQLRTAGPILIRMLLGMSICSIAIIVRGVS